MFDPEAAVRRVLELGAKNAAVVPMENVRFEKEFRNLCASNACGMYGKSWMCPPDIGSRMSSSHERRNTGICWSIRPSESWKTAMTLKG